MKDERPVQALTLLLCAASFALMTACQSSESDSESAVNARVVSSLKSGENPGDPDSREPTKISIVRVDPPPEVASPAEVLAEEQAALEASQQLRSVPRWVSRAMERGSDVVVLGTAVSEPTAVSEGHTFAVDVERRFRGSVPDRITVLQRADTLNECGRLRSIAGHRYILFLSRLASDADHFLLPETTGMSSDSNWLVETPETGLFKFDLGPYATVTEISDEVASLSVGGTE